MLTRAGAGSRQRSGEAGRGFIGFIVALIVVAYAGNALLTYYRIQSRADTLDAYAQEKIEEAVRLDRDPDSVRFDILKKAKELGTSLSNDDRVEVLVVDNQWRIRFSWEEEFRIPGYRKTLQYTVDKTFRRFNR